MRHKVTSDVAVVQSSVVEMSRKVPPKAKEKSGKIVRNVIAVCEACMSKHRNNAHRLPKLWGNAEVGQLRAVCLEARRKDGIMSRKLHRERRDTELAGERCGRQSVRANVLTVSSRAKRPTSTREEEFIER